MRTVGAYLRDLAPVSRLTRAQEYAVVQRIAKAQREAFTLIVEHGFALPELAAAGDGRHLPSPKLPAMLDMPAADGATRLVAEAVQVERGIALERAKPSHNAPKLARLIKRRAELLRQLPWRPIDLQSMVRRVVRDLK
ncbi:MAG: hypothetical protein DRI90_24120 [Deltaproteobacteria bacterium]|nr:MAG: hypothetical protein DRI90_24120 [Deltaproteobacteria bacterium]